MERLIKGEEKRKFVQFDFENLKYICLKPKIDPRGIYLKHKNYNKNEETRKCVNDLM